MTDIEQADKYETRLFGRTDKYEGAHEHSIEEVPQQNANPLDPDAKCNSQINAR